MAIGELDTKRKMVSKKDEVKGYIWEESPSKQTTQNVIHQ